MNLVRRVKKFKEYLEKNRHWDVVFIFALTFTVYVHNLSPSVFGGDAGDLITAALTRGVPHPSGYPLHTMLGVLFLKLPIAATPAWKVGLVSSLFSSLAVILMYEISYILTKRRTLSILTALTLAFTYSFWQYAEVAEVFALNSFFILALLLLTVKYLQNREKKFLYLLGFTAGLSLTNNQSIILFFPVIALVILWGNKKILLDFKFIIKAFLLFILGLTPYVYIPIAASFDPVMNWGYVVNMENFLHLVQRKYYGWGTQQVRSAFTAENITYRLRTYMDFWKVYVHTLIPFLATVGIVQLIRKKKFRIIFLFLGSFILVGPFFIVYGEGYFKSFLNLGIVERFFISSLLTSFVFLPFAFILLEDVIRKLPVRKLLRQSFTVLFTATFALVVAVNFLVNFPRLNFKDVYIGDNLALDLLSNLPRDSVLLVRNDSLAFSSIYYQEAYDYRRDVSIPGMYNGFETLLEGRGMSREEIERHKIRSKNGIDRDTLIEAIGPLIKERDVYVDGPFGAIEHESKPIITVPYGLVYKFEYVENLPYPKEEYVNEVEKITNDYHLSSLNGHEQVLLFNLILGDTKKLYSVGFFNIANYLHNQYQEDELGVKYVILSTKLDPFLEIEED